MLVFSFLTTYDGSIICKLKPVNVIQELERKTKLTILFCFDMLDEGAKTHIEEKRIKAVALEHATVNWYEGSVEFGCNY